MSPTEVGECSSEGHPLVLVDGADVGRGLLDLDVGRVLHPPPADVGHLELVLVRVGVGVDPPADVLGVEVDRGVPGVVELEPEVVVRQVGEVGLVLFRRD